MARTARIDFDRQMLAWLFATALGALVVAVFRSVAAAELLTWDDNTNIEDNWHLRSLAWDNVRWMFSDVQYSRRYMPLAWLDWAVDARFFGLTARSCHVGNLVLHVVNTVLVFFILRRIVARWLGPTSEVTAIGTIVAPMIGTALWAIHPLRVEVVAWASGRIYAQATLFALVSVITYLRSTDYAWGTWARRNWQWMSVAAFGGSLLTYPVAVSLLGVFVVLDHTGLGALPRADEPGRAAPSWSKWVEKVPFAVVTACVLGITVWARSSAGGIWEPPPTLEQFSLGSRAMQGFYIGAYFLWKPLLPLHLAPVYTTLISFNPADGLFVASAICVMGVTALLIWRRRQWPGLLAAWLSYLILLAPLLGFTEHPHFANDRYAHLATLPWSAVVAVAVLRVWPRVRWRAVALIASASAIAAGSVASLAQIGIWHDSESLFRHLLGEIGEHPYRADILMRLGDVQRIHGRLPEAERSLRESLQINPNSPWAQSTFARVMEEQGRTDEAIRHHRLALAIKPDLPVSNYRLGMLLLNGNDPAAAVAHFQAAAQATSNAPYVLEGLGEALLRLKRFADAIAVYETVLRINSSSYHAHNGMGAALVLMGRPAEAVPHFLAAAQSEPRFAGAHQNAGLALRMLGRLDEARQQFETALRLDPNSAAARDALTQLPKP